MNRKEPELQQGYEHVCPVWFHPRGDKMRIFALDSERKSLILKASAAHLTVGPHPKLPGYWIVHWELSHRGAQASGETSMSSDLLRRAFGLTDETEAAGDRLIDRYGGDTAFQGCYIRWRDCLNIPCPGTSYDGDSNISIFLRPEIKEAVRQLLALS